MRSFELIPLFVCGLAATASAQVDHAHLRRMVPLFEGPSEEHAAGDLDGDGDLDILLAGNFLDRVLLNDGTGRMTQASGLITDEMNVGQVALWDIDADGDVDAFLDALHDEVYLNDGSGALTSGTATWLPSLPALTGSSEIEPGDLDGDGDVDAVTCSGILNIPNQMLRNDGGSFSYVQVGPAITASYEVELADFDNDGDLDLWFMNFGPHYLYRNDGNLVMTSIVGDLPPMHFGNGTSTHVGDVDNDGFEDIFIATGRMQGAPNVLWRNTGAGFVDASAQLPGSWHETNASAMGDIDGDGDLDLWLSNRDDHAAVGGPNEVWFNDGAGVFAVAASGFLDDGYDGTLADFDGDGDLDLYVSAFELNRLELNDGLGGLVDVTDGTLPLGSRFVSASYLRDLDGDGDLDAFLASAQLSSGVQNRLYLNQGTGAFLDATATNLPVEEDETEAAAISDLDGDGDLDIALANHGVNPVLWNDGAASFTADTTALAASSLESMCALAADLTGNGFNDLLFGASSGGDVAFQNLGGGSFAVLNLGTPTNGRKHAAGDVDADGDLDLFVAGFENRYLLNDGAGGFADHPTFPATSEGQDVLWEDMDVDGDLDLVLLAKTPDLPTDAGAGGAGGSGVVFARQFYRNPGDGNLIDETFLMGTDPFQFDEEVYALDANEDGLPDLLFNSTQDTLLLNTGAAWHEVPFDLPGIGTASSIAIADVDRNGDLDFLITEHKVAQLLFDVRHQLSWASVPRIGKDLTLLLRGEASTPWFLLFSLGTLELPLPPYGTLRVDPSQPGGLLVAGSYSAAGAAEVTGAIANEVGLIGLTLYWQDLGGAQPSLGNLESTTFRDL